MTWKIAGPQFIRLEMAGHELFKIPMNEVNSPPPLPPE